MGKNSEFKSMVEKLFAEGEAEAAEKESRAVASQIRRTQDTLILATMRCKAADKQQEIADKAYKPAFLDLDQYRAWEVEEDIAKAARRKARTAAWEATRAFLKMVK